MSQYNRLDVPPHFDQEPGIAYQDAAYAQAYGYPPVKPDESLTSYLNRIYDVGGYTPGEGALQTFGNEVADVGATAEVGVLDTVTLGASQTTGLSNQILSGTSEDTQEGTSLGQTYTNTPPTLAQVIAAFAGVTKAGQTPAKKVAQNPKPTTWVEDSKALSNLSTATLDSEALSHLTPIQSIPKLSLWAQFVADIKKVFSPLM